MKMISKIKTISKSRQPQKWTGVKKSEEDLRNEYDIKNEDDLKNENWPTPPKKKSAPIPVKNYLKFVLMISHLNRHTTTDVKLEMEFHMINMIYVVLPTRAQIEKITFCFAVFCACRSVFHQ